MAEVAAWLMQIDRLFRVAVGQSELIHIIPSPEYIEIPRAPGYCKRVIAWNDEIIPVVDLSMLVNGVSAFHEQNSVAVTLYTEDNSSKLQYGGIQLIDMPRIDHVSNDHAIDREDIPTNWKPLSISAYRNAQGEIVPVLDTGRIFSAGINQLILQKTA